MTLTHRIQLRACGGVAPLRSPRIEHPFAVAHQAPSVLYEGTALARHSPAVQRVLGKLDSTDLNDAGPASISLILRDLMSRGMDPARTEDFLRSVQVINSAIHGAAIADPELTEARDLVTAYLAELNSKPR